MLTVTEACAREAVTSLPSESDENDIDDTPIKRRKIEYKVLLISFFVELVLTSLLYTG